MNPEQVRDVFGNKVRVRAMGVLTKDDYILLVNHKGLTPNNTFWAPPGGGVEIGESVEQTIVREFKEEVQLQVEVGDFLFVNEFIFRPLHAIEVFFEIKSAVGQVMLGDDPELKEGALLTDARFVSFEDLARMDVHNYHVQLRDVYSLDDLRQKKGSFYLSNKP